MKGKIFMALVTSAVMTVAASATSGPVDRKAGKSTITVGQFAAKVSRAIGFPAPDDRAAVEALRNARVDLGEDLSAPLTEGQAAVILRDLGLGVSSPGNLSAPISSGQAEQLVTTVAMTGMKNTSTEAVSGLDIPTACLYVTNRVVCDVCCLSILVPKYPRFVLLAYIACDTLCVRFFPPAPSASAPLP